MFLLVIIVDVILFQNGSLLFSNDILSNILFEPGSISKSLIQPLKLISIIKYPFFVFLIYYNSISNLRLNKFLIFFLHIFCCLDLRLAVDTFILPIILILYCSKSYLKKNIKKFIFFGLILGFILPIFSPFSTVKIWNIFLYTLC